MIYERRERGMGFVAKNISFHTPVFFACATRVKSNVKVVNTKQLKSDIQATMDKPLDSRSRWKQQI